MASIPQSMHDAMATLFGAGWLRDEAERLAYGYDNSRQLSVPDAVALPTRRDQVQALVRACREPTPPAPACRSRAAWWSRAHACSGSWTSGRAIAAR